LESAASSTPILPEGSASWRFRRVILIAVGKGSASELLNHSFISFVSFPQQYDGKAIFRRPFA
jgi:hypothetical protein